jgi:hypothetical protein
MNPALMSSLSSRDPRLLRQQQQQRDFQNQQRRPPAGGNDQLMRPNMPGRPMMGARPQNQQQMQQHPHVIRPHINPSRFPMGAPLSIMPPNRETIQKLDKIPRLSSRGGDEGAQDGTKKRDKSHSSSSSSKSKSGSSSSSRGGKYKSKDDSESPAKKSDKYHDKKKSPSSGSSSRKRGTSGSPSTKDSAASSSPKKATSSPSANDDKSEASSTATTSPDTMPAPPEIAKFKDIKSAKGRNYSRRNRNSSPEPVAAAASQDVDLRTLLPTVPEKKARLDAIIDDRIKDLNNVSGDELKEQSKIGRLSGHPFSAIWAG